MADVTRARLTLELALAHVDDGDQDDAYLRSAVRATIVLLGGDPPEEAEYAIDLPRRADQLAAANHSDYGDGTGRRSGW